MDTDDIMDKQNEYKNDKIEVLANWHYFLLLGESGLGKSTLMSSLFLNDLYKDRKVPGVEGKPIPYSGKINCTFFCGQYEEFHTILVTIMCMLDRN